MSVEAADRETLWRLNIALNGMESLATVAEAVLPEHVGGVLRVVSTLMRAYRHITGAMDVMTGSGEYHDNPFDYGVELNDALWYMRTYVQEGKWDLSNPIMKSAHETCTFAIAELIRLRTDCKYHNKPDVLKITLYRTIFFLPLQEVLLLQGKSKVLQIMVLKLHSALWHFEAWDNITIL